MSVRAYRVLIPAQLEDEPAFNLWREPEILRFIEEGDSVVHLEGGAGNIEVSVETLENLIKSLKVHPEKYTDESDSNPDEYIRATIKGIQKTVDDEKERGNTYVAFMCY